MAVVHGKDSEAFLNGYDVGSFINQATISAVKELNDCTVFNNAGYKLYHARMTDATASLSGYFDHTGAAVTDPDTGDYALEAALNATDNQLLYFPGGATAVGDRGFGFTGIVTASEIETESGDVSKASLEMQSSIAKENVKLLAPLATRTNTFTGTSLDNTAASTNGGAAYMVAPEWTSGTATITVEHSTDDSVWSTLATFGNVTADHDFERVAIAGTINRYTRAKAITTFVASFLVALNRK